VIFTVRLKFKGDDIQEGWRGHGRRRDGVHLVVRCLGRRHKENENAEKEKGAKECGHGQSNE
jgi:hypothetical protein